jgi:hypothetical protein
MQRTISAKEGNTMKKKYSTPEIVFESFALSTTIAGNCEKSVNTQSQGVCGYFMEGVGMAFTENVTGCSVVITDDMSLAFNGYCYHVPVDNQNLFNS